MDYKQAKTLLAATAGAAGIVLALKVVSLHKNVLGSRRKIRNTVSPEVFEKPSTRCQKRCLQEVLDGPSVEFWSTYKLMADPELGQFFHLHSFVFGQSFNQIVALADEAPTMYNSFDTADAFRHWLAYRLAALDGDAGVSLANEIEAMDFNDKRAAMAPLVYLRHMWHQGNPKQPPVSSEDVLDQYGCPVVEPRQLSRPLSLLSHALDVDPFLNVQTWMFFNWTLKCDDCIFNHSLPDAPSFGNTTSHESRTLRLTPRFTWLVGSDRETEVIFWRAFAYTEAHALPLYGLAGRIVTALESSESVTEKVNVIRQSLESMAEVLDTLRDVLATYVRSDVMEADAFLKMQATAHYAGTTAGASGFQIPFMVLLDSLLGTDFSTLSSDITKARNENLHEMNRNLVDLIFRCVDPAGVKLRDLLHQPQGQQLKEAYNKVVHRLVLWRSSHRSRASEFLQGSEVTTGRTAEEMEHSVRATFQREMNDIIHATKSLTLK